LAEEGALTAQVIDPRGVEMVRSSFMRWGRLENEESVGDFGRP